MDEHTFPASVVEQSATHALESAGMDHDHAALVTRILVDADERGHHSHGVELVPTCVQRLHRGGINPEAAPRWESDPESSAARPAADGGPEQVPCCLLHKPQFETRSAMGSAP